MSAASGNWPRDALPRKTVLNGFEIEAVLGRGGFGITYRVRDKIDQLFAIKECFPRQFAVRQGLEVLPTDTGDTEAFAGCLDRFMDEARALTRLSKIKAAGDGVVKVTTVFEANGTAYILMEYIAGQSLETWMKANRSGIDSRYLSEILDRLLHALASVHEAGLLHRDIKPANILLREDGRPVLIDFGAARMLTGASGDTAFTQIYSRYHAPIEQFSGERQDRFSDIYALGMTCYQAIGGTAIDAFARQQAADRGQPDPLPPAARIGAGRYPPMLLAAIDAALAVASDKRPKSVANLQALLGAGDNPTVLRPPDRPRPEPDPAPPPDARPLRGNNETTWLAPPRKPKRRSRRAAGIAAVPALAVALLGLGMTQWPDLQRWLPETAAQRQLHETAIRARTEVAELLSGLDTRNREKDLGRLAQKLVFNSEALASAKQQATLGETALNEGRDDAAVTAFSSAKDTIRQLSATLDSLEPVLRQNAIVKSNRDRNARLLAAQALDAKEILAPADRLIQTAEADLEQGRLDPARAGFDAASAALAEASRAALVQQSTAQAELSKTKLAAGDVDGAQTALTAAKKARQAAADLQ